MESREEWSQRDASRQASATDVRGAGQRSQGNGEFHQALLMYPSHVFDIVNNVQSGLLSVHLWHDNVVNVLVPYLLICHVMFARTW